MLNFHYNKKLELSNLLEEKITKINLLSLNTGPLSHELPAIPAFGYAETTVNELSFNIIGIIQYNEISYNYGYWRNYQYYYNPPPSSGIATNTYDGWYDIISQNWIINDGFPEDFSKYYLQPQTESEPEPEPEPESEPEPEPEALPYESIQIIDNEVSGLENSLAINSNGDTIIVGSKYGGYGSNESRWNIYKLNNNLWELDISFGNVVHDSNLQRIHYGTSAINSQGNRVVLGSSYNNTNQGYLRVYEYNGSNWSQLGQDFTGGGIYDYFGSSVAINSQGNRIVVGAPQDDGNGSANGYCRIYEYDSYSNQWVQLGADILGLSNSNFGTSVSINNIGNRVVIGGPKYDYNGISNSGYCVVYEYISGNWTQLGGYIYGSGVSDGRSVVGDKFGYSVSMNSDGSRIVVGGPSTNTVRIYEYDGTDWGIMGNSIVGVKDSQQNGLGNSVSINETGNIIVLGAIYAYNSNFGYHVGDVSVYSLSGNSTSGYQWNLIKLIVGDAAGKKFGGSISINSDGSVIVTRRIGNNPTRAYIIE